MSNPKREIMLTAKGAIEQRRSIRTSKSESLQVRMCEPLIDAARLALDFLGEKTT